MKKVFLSPIAVLANVLLGLKLL